MNGMCAIGAPRCGHIGAVERHHLLGRGADGAYVEPQLLVALCGECHQSAHRLLGLAGLDGRREATPALLLRRLAVGLRWLAWTEPVPPSGAVLVGWPAIVRGVAEVLDQLGRELEAAR